MPDTILQQGFFTSTGTTQTLQIRSGVDWISTRNYTRIAAQTGSAGYEFYWQLGMPQGGGIEYQSNAGSTAVNTAVLASGGFTIVDSSLNPLGAPVATTASTNAAQPVFSTASTAGLSAGSIVRIVNVAGQPNLSGYDFSIDTVVANTSFRIANALANAPGAAGTTGIYYLVNFNPLFYPARRNIVNITAANPAVITTAVNHGYVVGQAVRLYVPTVFGMTQANGLLVNISAVTASTFTVNMDFSAFTAFVFPGAAAVPFTPAYVVPVGEETDQYSNPNLLDDATLNTGYIGVTLGAGVNGPAGQNADVVYWVAGKSFNT